ncbi:rhodanese-like domain-containing protein [Kaarinaea lacus]
MYFNIQEINANELADWMNQQEKPFRVIDVREIREISNGTIPGAEPMPLATVPLRSQDLQPEEKLVFVCHSGARSAQACAFLQQQGFNNVYNLQGGLVNWAANGLPAEVPQLRF